MGGCGAAGGFPGRGICDLSIRAKKNKKKCATAKKMLAFGAKNTIIRCPLGCGAGGFCMVVGLQKVLCGFAKVLLWSANVRGTRHW